MRAVVIDHPGPVENFRLVQIDPPAPGPGEVQVRVRAASVNPIDLYIRSGTVPMSLPLPFSSGCDFAGEVSALGQGVSGFQLGQRVWGSNQGLLGRQGTLREYIAVACGYVYPSPEGVSDETLAGSALTGITAHLALFANGALKAGDKVVIQGGSGGVGSMAVQMARIAGAKVATTVRDAAKAQLAQSLGAEKTVLFGEEIYTPLRDWAAPSGIDVWLETQREPDFLNIVPGMAARGRIVILAGRTAQPVFPVGPFYVKGLTLKGFAMFNATPQEQAVCAADMGKWLASGALTCPVGKVFELEQAADAHRFLAENTLGFAGALTGKVVIRIEG